MVTFEKTEQGLRLGINIRPAGYEEVSLDPKGIVCEIVGKDSGALLQRLEGQLEGDMLSILVDTDGIHALDIYRLMVSYKLRDELFSSGYRVVSLSEPAFEVKRIENVSVLGGGHNERAIEIVGIGQVQTEDSQGAQAINFATLSPEQIEALKTALGVNTAAGSGADINSLLKADIDPSAFSEVEGAENINTSLIFLGGRSTAQVIWNLYTNLSKVESILGDLIQDLILKEVIKFSDYKYRGPGTRMYIDLPE